MSGLTSVIRPLAPSWCRADLVRETTLAPVFTGAFFVAILFGLSQPVQRGFMIPTSDWVGLPLSGSARLGVGL